jgi:hypothetical protein
MSSDLIRILAGHQRFEIPHAQIPDSDSDRTMVLNMSQLAFRTMRTVGIGLLQLRSGGIMATGNNDIH